MQFLISATTSTSTILSLTSNAQDLINFIVQLYLIISCIEIALALIFVVILIFKD